MQELFDIAKARIIETIVERMDFSKELSDEEVLSAIDDAIILFPDRNALPLEKILELRKEIYNSLRRYDVIQDFLDDDSVTEIMINGKDNIFIEKDGRVFKTAKRFDTKEKLEDVIQQIVAGCNRSVNEASPIQDARLSTGERVNIVLSPIALNGPIVTIRRFPDKPITMDRLVEIGSLTKEAAGFLKALVEAKYNIFISGGTGSGKTTFLNALSQYIPEDERIITIEDSAELKILGIENLVSLETRTKNSEGCNPIDIRDLIRSALRMRPDRVIVGEVRGAEAIDMLQAMNTGHDGSMSTGHGNSSKDMLSRLETMVLSGMDIPIHAIRNQIESGIDIFVHLGRTRDKRRRVMEISETNGIEGGEIKLHRLFEVRDGELVKVDSLINDRKLRA